MPRRRTAGLTGRSGVRKLPNGGFYRITGYRNAAGRWVIRNPRTGHWYVQGSRNNGSPPTVGELKRSDRLNIEVERNGAVKYLNVSPAGLGL
jgi:hypothetical protein